MGKLANPKNTIAVVSQHDFDFRKRFGQNFLVDEGVILRALEAAGVNKNDVIFEIGPGIGTLTQYLCEAAHSVAAIEIDRKLIPVLEDTLKEWDNVDIVNQDILKMDLVMTAEKYNNGNPVKVVANLPYYITTPIIMALFEDNVPLDSITVMIQKEVADRMQALPGTADYGALSLAVQYYAETRITARVPQNCFMPRPNVDSTVICLKRYRKPPVMVKDEKLMFKLIKASFNQRRKTLANGIKNADFLSFGKEEIDKAMTDCGLPLNIRGEALSLAQFARLSDRLSGFQQKI